MITAHITSLENERCIGNAHRPFAQWSYQVRSLPSIIRLSTTSTPRCITCAALLMYLHRSGSKGSASVQPCNNVAVVWCWCSVHIVLSAVNDLAPRLPCISNSTQGPCSFSECDGGLVGGCHAQFGRCPSWVRVERSTRNANSTRTKSNVAQGPHRAGCGNVPSYWVAPSATSTQVQLSLYSFLFSIDHQFM